MTEAHWRMMGHVLRMATDTPAQLALWFALQGAIEYKGLRDVDNIRQISLRPSELISAKRIEAKS